jgi:clan AA aspartic protease
MMSGYVNDNREAMLQIAIVGDNKQLRSLRSIVDTGFSGDLTLSRDLIIALGFTLRGIQRVTLGDGRPQNFDMFVGNVIWDGQMRQVEINASESGSLIGMGLLEGYRLEVEGIPGGEVLVKSL